MRGTLAMLLMSSGVVASCGPAAPPPVAQVQQVTPSKPGPSAIDELRTQAATAEQEGVMDVAAEYRRRVYELAPSDQAKAEWAGALEQACAFERARAVRAEAAQTRAGSMDPDAEKVERALVALAAKDPKAAREALGASPSAPLELELLGRADLLAGDRTLARKRFACARSRIDAAGMKLGFVATEAGAVEHLDWRDGRLIVARSRERYLIGGYQSNATHSEWIEQIAPGDRDPLVRFPVGNMDGFAVSRDRRSVALIDRPLDQIVAPVPTTARRFDTRTGQRLAAWPVTDVRGLQYGPDASTLLVMGPTNVAAWDLSGATKRTFALSGSTPGVMRVYRAHPGSGPLHDNVPVTYPTAPVVVTSALNGTVAVGATDGTIWVWRPGATAAALLKESKTPPSDEREALNRRPIAMRLDDAGTSLAVVRGDGGIVSWDLGSRRSRVIAEPRCTDAEARAGVYGSGPLTPENLAQCAQARYAAINPQRTRVVLSSLMGPARVRDAQTGAAVTLFDTLEADTAAFADDAGSRVWLGGVQGSVAEWDVATGKRLRELAQGGINGFVHALSGDGRFVAIADSVEGYRERAPPITRIWDTSARRIMDGLPALGWVRFAADRPVMVAAGMKGQGAFVWDFATGKTITKLDSKDEGAFELTADASRVVGHKGASTIVVHDLHDRHGAPREIDLGSAPWAFALDRGAHTAAAISESNELTVWNLDDGKNLLRATAPQGSAVSLSPDGSRVAWRASATEVVVTSVADGKEIARLASKDLVPDQDYQPIHAGEFVTNDSLLLVGPGAPGYERVYRWKVGDKAAATELQVLGGDRMQIASNGVATIYDRNDMAHLLRVSDGALLASVHATRGGGWIAESRDGAVDGPPDGQSALVSLVEGDVLVGGSSWLAWDRFAVPELLKRAASGQLVPPPIAGLTLRADTLRSKN